CHQRMAFTTEYQLGTEDATRITPDGQAEVGAVATTVVGGGVKAEYDILKGALTIRDLYFENRSAQCHEAGARAVGVDEGVTRDGCAVLKRAPGLLLQDGCRQRRGRAEKQGEHGGRALAHGRYPSG